MTIAIEVRDMAAKKAFYQEFARSASNRPGPFLRRNLRSVLDWYEEQQVTDATLEEGMGMDSHASARPSHVKWHPPPGGIIEELIQARQPQLCINSLLIRHKTSDSKASRQTVARGRERRSQSWVPQTGDWKLPISVGVLIHYKAQAKREVYRNRIQAEVVRFKGDDGKPVFNVALKKPFLLDLDQLSVPKEVPSSDSNANWTKALSDKYTLEISLRTRDSEDAATLLSQLENRPKSHYSNVPSNEGVVRIVWGDLDTDTTTKIPGLPQLPSDHQLLLFRRAKNRKSLELQYGAEIAMGWNKKPALSVLADYNMKQAMLERKRQLPTPSVSDDAREPERRRGPRSVRYLFQSHNFIKREYEMESLSCIFCEADEEHSSFLQLLNHYRTHHDHFTIDVEDDEAQPDVKIMSMKLKLDEDQYGATSESENENFDWEAPNSLLNIAAHIDGDQTWTIKPGEPMRYLGQPSTKNFRSKCKVDRPAKSATTSAAPSETPSVTSENPMKRGAAPEDVLDLPPRKRRKHPVPDVPGVSFYKINSKQVLVPGEEVSDSDEDPDDTWIVQSQRNDLRKLGLSAIELEFNELLNAHLNDERPQSDTFVGHALVRFSRRYAQKLGRPVWRDLLRSKLELFYTRQIITKAHLDYCMDVVSVVVDAEQQAPLTPVSEPRGEKDASDVRPSRIRLNGFLAEEQQTPLKPASEPRGERDASDVRPSKIRLNGFLAEEQQTPLKPASESQGEKAASDVHRLNGLLAEEEQASLKPVSESRGEKTASDLHPSKRRIHGLLQARGSNGQLASGYTDPDMANSPKMPELSSNVTLFRKRSTPDLANLTPNSKFRARWKNGRMVRDAEPQPTKPTAQAENGSMPFGQRSILCRRAPKVKMKEQEIRTYEIPISELLKDKLRSKPPDQIQPRDLDYLKLRRTMDDLLFFRDSDNIVYVSDSRARLITKGDDFYAAMESAKCTLSNQDIVFELQGIPNFLTLLQTFKDKETTSRPEESDEAVIETQQADPTSPVKVNGKSRVSESPPAKRDVCICGKRVEGYRGTIGCGNVLCARNFHMQCVGLAKRPPLMDWTCMDCSSRTTSL